MRDELHPFRNQRVEGPPTLPPPAHEALHAQDPKVMRKQRLRNVAELIDELADARLTIRQGQEETKARRLREDGDKVGDIFVEMRLIG